jgi:hypothetical protein
MSRQSKEGSDNLVGVGSNTISKDIRPGLLTARKVHVKSLIFNVMTVGNDLKGKQARVLVWYSQGRRRGPEAGWARALLITVYVQIWASAPCTIDDTE